MNGKLAIEGGEKTWNQPAPQWPVFDMSVMQDIGEILETGRVNYWTGPRGQQFEHAFAAWNGVAHAISTSNGTTALHTAVAALGIGPGDEVHRHVVFVHRLLFLRGAGRGHPGVRRRQQGGPRDQRGLD